MHMWTRSLLAFFAITGASLAHGQQIYRNTGTGNSTFLLGNDMAAHTQCLYLPGDLIGPVDGDIIRLYYRYGSTGQAAGNTLGNLLISLGQTTATVFNNADEYFTGLDTALFAISHVIAPGTTGDWFAIDLPVPFAYDATQTLIVDIQFATTVNNALGCLGVPNNGRKLYSATPGSITGSTTSATWQDIGFDLLNPSGVLHNAFSNARAWPNPVGDLLTIDFGTYSTQQSTITLHDAIGRRVLQLGSGTAAGAASLDVSGLPSGIYTLVIAGAEGRYAKAIAVQH